MNPPHFAANYKWKVGRSRETQPTYTTTKQGSLIEKIRAQNVSKLSASLPPLLIPAAAVP